MTLPSSLCLAASLGALWFGASLPAAPSLAGSRPNILFILSDDQGYGDLSVHGNPLLKTVHLDRLHQQSARFTDFHVSPTCSPTRAALMTGRHEFKNGVTHTIFERERLTLDAVTIAQVLKQAGYQTGIFGKWHLGDEAAYQPDRRGFDEVFIHGGGGIGQMFPGSCGDAPGNTYFDPAILHNGRFEKTKGFCTDVFFAQATRWIEAARQKGAPFFAYVALNAPHAPYTARPEDTARFKGQVPDDVANFLGMVQNIDDNVGRILARLDTLGLTDNTLVIFMNDNGGTAGVSVHNAGMRGSKLSPLLGGTRAISFWRLPGRIAPRDISSLAAHIDVFPTVAALAGVKLDGAVAAQVEGRSLVPLLSGGSAEWPERLLFTHGGRWPRFSDPDLAQYKGCAVRSPQWHLVSEQGGRQPQWALYEVSQDPAEARDVAAQHPDVVRELAAAYDRWWQSAKPGFVNEKAVGPRINPFKEHFWQQLGGGPDAEDLRVMEPSQKTIPRRKATSAP